VAGSGVVVVPLGLRAVDRAVRPPDAAPSYIPSVETPRARSPFDSGAVASLREAANDYILIGDSMAGTRNTLRFCSRDTLFWMPRHQTSAAWRSGARRDGPRNTIANADCAFSRVTARVTLSCPSAQATGVVSGAAGRAA